MPPMRIHRALARAGIASRRRAEALVLEGRVQVDGHVAHIGQVIDPERQTIVVDGAPIGAAPAVAHWLVLNKPAGYVTSRSDPQKRPTVFELVDHVAGLIYVGRLDYMTEGVLLFTTDGDAAHWLTHPSREVERTYVATVRGDARVAAVKARAGVELEDGPVYPRDVHTRAVGAGRSELELTITEGRTREVRRLCAAMNLDLERLVRIRFGPVKLGTLPSGKTRPLNARERAAITELVR
jgi:23S rRNA pseudouridine2605 synthase